MGIFIAAFGDKLLNTKSSLIIPCSYLIGPFENVISAIDQTLCVRPDLRVQSANNPRLRNLHPSMVLQFFRTKQIIYCELGLVSRVSEMYPIPKFSDLSDFESAVSKISAQVNKNCKRI